MQDAYISEQGDKLGSWKQLGYEIGTMDEDLTEGTTQSFTFTDGLTDGNTDLSENKAAGWTATSTVALNKCESGSTWTLTPTASTTGNGASWTAAIDKSECETLTPQFTQLSNTTSTAK